MGSKVSGGTKGSKASKGSRAGSRTSKNSKSSRKSGKSMRQKLENKRAAKEQAKAMGLVFDSASQTSRAHSATSVAAEGKDNVGSDEDEENPWAVEETDMDEQSMIDSKDLRDDDDDDDAARLCFALCRLIDSACNTRG